VAICTVLQARALSSFLSVRNEAMEQANRIATEYVREIKSVKSLAKETTATAHYAAFLEVPHRIAIRNFWTLGVYAAFQAAVSMLTVGIGMYAANTLIPNGNVTFSNALIVIMNLMITLGAIAKSSTVVSSFTKAKKTSTTVGTFSYQRTWTSQPL